MVPLDDLEAVRDLLGVFVGPGLDGAAPRTAAELELLALDGIGPFAHPQLPPEIVQLFAEALMERGDVLAAGILAALAELAPPPLRECAAGARDQLAAEGLTSPFADAVGTL